MGHTHLTLPGRTVEPTGETPVPEQTPGHRPRTASGVMDPGQMLTTPATIDSNSSVMSSEPGASGPLHLWEPSPSPRGLQAFPGSVAGKSANSSAKESSEVVGYIPPPIHQNYSRLSFSLDLGDLHSPREPPSYWSPRVFRKAGRRPPEAFHSQLRPSTNREIQPNTTTTTTWARLTVTSPGIREQQPGDRVSFTEISKSWEILSPSNGHHARKKIRTRDGWTPAATGSQKQQQQKPQQQDADLTQEPEEPIMEAEPVRRAPPPKVTRRRRRRRRGYNARTRRSRTSDVNRHGLRGSNGRFVSRRALQIEMEGASGGMSAQPPTDSLQLKAHQR